MRWLLGRDPGACGTCGVDLVRDASWCGSCGASVTDPDQVEVETVLVTASTAPTSAPEPARRRGRVGGVLLVLGLVGALVVAGLARTPPPVPLLGTPAASGGVSSSGPPPSGLRVAWRHELGDDIPVGFSTYGPVLVAGDEQRIAVDGRVVDRATGRLVRLDSWQGQGELLLQGDVVLRTDPLSGESERLATLPVDAVGWPMAVIDDVIVLAADQTVTFLGRDGRQIATVDGRFEGYLDRVDGAAALLPVRGGSGDPSGDVLLVDPRRGEVVRTLVADEEVGRRTQVVDVIGTTVVHATTSDAISSPGGGVPWRVPAPGEPGAGVAWRVRVLDPVTGASGAATEVVSAYAPRLLGTRTDGTVVVGGRSGAELTVWLLPPEDAAGKPFLTTRVATPTSGDLYGHGDGDITGQAFVVDDLVVVADAERDALRAVDAAGREVWRVDRDGAERIGEGDGFVALLHADRRLARDRGARVIDAADGSRVVVVPPAVDPYFRGRAPAAVHDGHVAMGAGGGGWFGRVELDLMGARWLDLRDGDVVPVADVFERFLPDGQQPSGSWSLHGLTSTPERGPAPVVTRVLDRDSLQLLEPGIGFDTIDLGAAPGADAGVSGYDARVIGASATHLVVQRQAFETGRETSHVVDRETGDVRSLPDVAALGLFGDVVLGVEFGDTAPNRSGPTLVGLTVDDGTERWRIQDAGEVLFGDNVVVGGDLLAAVGRGGVLVLDLQDGVIRWRQDAPASLSSTAVVLGARHLVVTTTDGQLLALDRDDGTERWRTALGTPVTSVTGAGDDVLVGTVDGLVVHIDAGGREVQRIAVGTTAVTAIAAVGDTVVAVVDGAAIGLRAGGNGIVEQDEVDLP